MGAPRANPAVEAKSADVHETVNAELAKRLKADNARNTEHAEMPAWRAAHRASTDSGQTDTFGSVPGGA
jgi:hypothetical protein